jgi:hypothetical protein
MCTWPLRQTARHMFCISEACKVDCRVLTSPCCVFQRWPYQIDISCNGRHSVQPCPFSIDTTRARSTVKIRHARTEASRREGELGPRGFWWADRGHAKSKRVGRPDSKHMRLSNDCQTTHCLRGPSSWRARYCRLFVLRVWHHCE